MAIVDVECSECGAALQVDEAEMGSTMTCPKCKLPFFVEPAGAYGLVEDPPKRRSRSPRPESDSGSGSAAVEPPETAEQRRIREQMERWAGSDD
ncbi:hypothetical protein [Tautonia rosea]|uniref:hypothetical protein n=1 Tax=Tautonia rosea TaxID=2728037 RepID=UPI00147552E9|nr:hypothetical protein [Tautonia rosea]